MRIAQNIDVMPIGLAIKRRLTLWHDDTYLRDYPQGPFGEIESIILRFPPRSVHETEEAMAEHLVGFDQYECNDLPAFKTLPEARALVFQLMAAVSGERLGRVMINNIKPGGRIYPHADTPAHAEYYSRFHIVLESSPGIVFRCGDEHAYMAVGEAWWFNNADEHEVINNSGQDRIHMIVDIRTSR